jgi:hypothetical protein
MSDLDKDEGLLDAAFGAARAAPATPPPDLIARVLQDALREMPVPAPRSARGGWLSALGGWPVLGGLLTAGVAGFWIGVAPPAGVSEWVSARLGLTLTVALDATDPLSLLEG